MRVAAIQATPVILDAEACIDKAIALLHEAADDGVELAVLPETFVPLYPSNAWARSASGFAGWDDFWVALWSQSVDVPGPLVTRLAETCRARDLHCVIGVNEREADRPGSLYNTMLTIGPGGLLARHRKLMPTQHERLFHGVGAGDDLAVADTPIGRIGGLICWENRMPLARWAVYQGGPQIWVAPTADDSDGWLASMRHIAIESGAFVVSVPQYIPASAFPADFPVRSQRWSRRPDVTATRGQGSTGLRPDKLTHRVHGCPRDADRRVERSTVPATVDLTPLYLFPPGRRGPRRWGARAWNRSRRTAYGAGHLSVGAVERGNFRRILSSRWAGPVRRGRAKRRFSGGSR